MAKGVGWRSAARELRAVFESGTVGDLSDGQLLERFVASREGPIFGALVGRHAPMVWGVCRRVLGDHHDAEDAFQATFLVLARKAATVRPPEKVGSWLHGVASRTALKARSTRARRRAKEGSPVEFEPGSTPESPDDRLPLLDRELGLLPEKYRMPIVLCELEGMTHQQAASALGWPVGTVSGRLSRGRSLLADRLRRGGVAPDLMASFAAFARESATAGLSARLLASTCSLEAAGTFPAGVVSLAEGVWNSMMLAKIKGAVAVLVPVAILAAGAGWVAGQQGDPKPKAKDEPRPQATAPAAAAVATKPLDPAIRALMEARLATAREASSALIELFQNARVDLDEVVLWPRRRVELELQLHPDPASRLAAIREYLQMAEMVEAICNARVQNARAPFSQTLVARYHRLEAEQMLAEFRLANPGLAIPEPPKDPNPAPGNVPPPPISAPR